MRTITIILLIYIANIAAYPDSKPVSNKLKLQTERVIIFKNGYCLVEKKPLASQTVADSFI